MTLGQYFDRGFTVRSSHCDPHGNHYLVLQMNQSVVMACIEENMWTGKPKTGEDDIACWEIN